jgi:tetratricopeptide (TPR) repeat protein
MLNLVDRALTLNASYARGWLISGLDRLYAGQTDIAIEHIETSMRLSPRARVGTSLLGIGIAHFFNRRFDEAASRLLLALQEDPTFPMPYQFLAACYAHLGRLNEAQELVARLRSLTPGVVPDISFMRNPEHRELFLSGIRLAIGETVRPA